jgi:diacylglycerol kinase family enzyme
MTPPRILVLLNSHSGTLASGTGDEARQIADGFHDRGVAAEVRLVDPERAGRAVEAARRAGYAAVVAGGGDGTINAVANAMAVAGKGMAFGVLPLGTHNHFAKDLGIPLDLDAALTAVADALLTGRGVVPLDLAEVNGRLFLNFSGLGLHPHVVDRRDGDHAELKRWRLLHLILRKFLKPLALVVSFVRSLGSLPILRLTLVADGRRRFRVTPSLLVCTNVHQMEVFGVSGLSVPQRGVLNVYVARTRRLIGLVRLLLAAATRRLKALREFESLAATDLTIHYRRPTLRVSVDGEVVRLRTPLHYRIRKAALTVVAPGRAAPESADGTEAKITPR